MKNPELISGSGVLASLQCLAECDFQGILERRQCSRRTGQTRKLWSRRQGESVSEGDREESATMIRPTEIKEHKAGGSPWELAARSPGEA